MKPKNLILIGVAVVCGLAAAFLTARMMAGAGTKKPELDMVEVPVAVKDIPIGTKLPPKDVETYFTKKNFPRESVPPSAITSLEEIGDKRAMRTIRQGETVSVTDLNAKGFIDPPKGTVLMTTAINLEQSASGFALPGYKVMVIASKKSQKKNMDIVFPLFLDALILAVDTSTTAPQAGGQNGQNGQQNKDGGATAAGFQSVGMISFAVTPDQSMLLTMAANGGATLRLGLPHQDDKEKQVVIDGYQHLLPTRQEILNIFADRWPDDDKSAENGPKVETVKVKVPAELVAKDTRLTQEVLDKKFKTIEFPKELLPEAVAAEEKDLLDQYATADLVAGLQVPRPHLSKSEPKKAEVIPVEPGKPMALAGVKAGHSDDAASPKVDTSFPEPKAKEYVYVLINTPQGKRYQKFEVTASGNVFAGEATEEEYLQYQAGKGGKAPAK